MAKQALQFPFPQRGVVDERNAKDIPADALSACTNMYYPRPGVLRSRGGIDDTYNGPASPVKMYYWDYDSKIYSAGSSLYKDATQVTTDDIVDIVSYGITATPILILAKSDGTLHTYTGTTYAALTGTAIPTGITFLMVRNSRLYAATKAGRIYYSDAGDYTKFSGAIGEGGYFDVFPGEGGDVVDWLDFGGVLYIFKEHGIYKVTGADKATHSTYKDTSVDKVLAGTIVDVGRGVLYATSYGVFPLGVPVGDEAYDLTKNVEATLQTFLASGASAAYSPELSAYVLVNGSTTAWVSNIGNRPDVWTSFALPEAMDTVHQGNGLWFGAVSGETYLYDHDDTTDDAADFTVSFKTGHWDIGDASKRKTIVDPRGHFNAGRNATATVSFYVNGSGTAKKTKALTAAVEQVFQTKFSCRQVALGVVYTTLTGPVKYGGCACSLAEVMERK